MIEYIVFMDWVNILKILVLPNISHWIHCNPNKNSDGFLCRNQQVDARTYIIMQRAKSQE